MKINIKDLEKRIVDGYLRKQKHPTLDLYIYNYTDLCAYSKSWDEYTLMCRGLVLDLEGNIVARAYDKFFNLGEGVYPNEEPKTLQEITEEHGNYMITEKVDGSLGILFFYNGQWICATRGSFNSEQSNMMQSMLDDKRGLDIRGLDNAEKYTHLFEIIYPENRIVVNYGDQKKLVYLGSRDTETGEIKVFETISDRFPTPQIYGAMVDNLPNAEGYVLWFNDGFMVKVKFEEYKRLHKIVTGLNVKGIWEMLADNQSFDEILKDVPDEFYKWLGNNIATLKAKYKEIDKYAKNDFEAIYQTLGEPMYNLLKEKRKDFAKEAIKTKYPQLMFAMLDNRDITPMIWKLIKPSGDSKFKNIDNE